MVLCVFVYQKHPKAQPIVVLEKPRIEPAIPDLQGNALIHYITAAKTLVGYFEFSKILFSQAIPKPTHPTISLNLQFLKINYVIHLICKWELINSNEVYSISLKGTCWVLYP